MDYLTLLRAVESVVRGKREVAEYLLAALLAGGHALLEDIPGEIGRASCRERV